MDELRSNIILVNNLYNMDIECTFYYDETNNIRKFHIIEDGFNVVDPGNFVLGGVLHTGLKHNLNTDNLLKDLKLQRNTKELKLKYVAKGDFERILSSEKLGIIFNWLNDNNLYVHYFNLNIIYWSLADIVDSVLSETAQELIPYSMILKSDLYKVLTQDRDLFVLTVRKYGYPNIKNEYVHEFSVWLLNFVHDHINVLSNERAFLLNLFFEKMVHQTVLPFLTGEEDNVLINNFSSFYIRTIYLFNNSSHVFDKEDSVISKLGGLNLMIQGKQLNNFRFENSENEIFVQLSDVIVGFLGKYFTFIRQNSYSKLVQIKSSLNPHQINNLSLLKQLIDRSDNLSNGLFNMIVSEDEHQNNAYFLHNVVAQNSDKII